MMHIYNYKYILKKNKNKLTLISCPKDESYQSQFAPRLRHSPPHYLRLTRAIYSRWCSYSNGDKSDYLPSSWIRKYSSF